MRSLPTPILGAAAEGHDGRPSRRRRGRALALGVALATALTGGIATAAGATNPPATSATQPDLGPNVVVFDPSMPVSQIQATVDAVNAQQIDAEMGTGRHALLFKPGVYGTATEPLQIKVGYYTEVAGLGASPTAELHTVSIDLREDWPAALRASGFDETKPTAWSAEGLLVYLPPDAQDRLFDHITALSAPGSRLVFEHSGKAKPKPDVAKAAAHALSLPGAGRFGAHFKGGLGPTGRDWLSGQGWTTHSADRAEVGRRYGRPDTRLPGGEFVTATRG